MKRLVYALLAAVLFVVPVGAQIRTIGGSSGGTCCSAATITPIDSIRFTGTTSSILGGTGNMTIQAGTGNSRTLALRATNGSGTAIGWTINAAGAFMPNTDNTHDIGDDVTGPKDIYVRGVLRGTNGSLAAPHYAFSSGLSTGLYLGSNGSSDSLSMSSNGAAFAAGLHDTLIIRSKAKAPSLTAAAGTPNTVCINATTKEITENAATSCVVSSRRFKRNIVTLQPAVASRIASQLRPVSFSYKDGGRQAIGLIAEEADSVDYRLASRDSKGQLNSVNYEQISVILLSVVQEQQKKFARMCAAGIKEAC